MPGPRRVDQQLKWSATCIFIGIAHKAHTHTHTHTSKICITMLANNALERLTPNGIQKQQCSNTLLYSIAD